MQIFLAYASEDRAAAEGVFYALVGDGHEVFFDRASLPPGGDYNARIREAIRRSDLVVFLISEASIADQAYTQTELAFARARWPHPAGRVIPVMLRPTDLGRVPAYLKAVTILEPRGDVGAELVEAIRTLPASSLIGAVRRRLVEYRQVLLAASLVAVALAFLADGPGERENLGSGELLRELALLRADMQALKEKATRTEADYLVLQDNLSRLSPGQRDAFNARLSSELSTRLEEYPEAEAEWPMPGAEDATEAEGPGFPPEAATDAAMLQSIRDLDEQIERQAQFIDANRNTPGVSADVETMKLKRLIDRRSQMFDMLRQVIDKYNTTAKGLIDDMGR